MNLIPTGRSPKRFLSMIPVSKGGDLCQAAVSSSESSNPSQLRPACHESCEPTTSHGDERKGEQRCHRHASHDGHAPSHAHSWGLTANDHATLSQSRNQHLLSFTLLVCSWPHASGPCTWSRAEG